MTDLLDKAHALEAQLRADERDLSDWRPGDHQVIADTLRDLSAEVVQWRRAGDGLKDRIIELSAERDAALARVKELEAEVARLVQRVRDQDDELTAHAERGHRQLMEAMAGHRARKP